MTTLFQTLKMAYVCNKPEDLSIEPLVSKILKAIQPGDIQFGMKIGNGHPLGPDFVLVVDLQLALNCGYKSFLRCGVP